MFMGHPSWQCENVNYGTLQQCMLTENHVKSTTAITKGQEEERITPWVSCEWRSITDTMGGGGYTTCQAFSVFIRAPRCLQPVQYNFWALQLFCIVKQNQCSPQVPLVTEQQHDRTGSVPPCSTSDWLSGVMTGILMAIGICFCQTANCKWARTTRRLPWSSREQKLCHVVVEFHWLHAHANEHHQRQLKV